MATREWRPHSHHRFLLLSHSCLQLVIPTLDSVRYEHLLGLVHSVGKATLVGCAGVQGCRGGENRHGGARLWPLRPASPPRSSGAHTWQAATSQCLASPSPSPSVQLVGGPGTAKTSTIQQFLGRFSKEEHSSKTITFSYLTTPGIFQTSMEVGGCGEEGSGRQGRGVQGTVEHLRRAPRAYPACAPHPRFAHCRPPPTVSAALPHLLAAGRRGEAPGTYLWPARRQVHDRLCRRHLHARHQRVGGPGGCAVLWRGPLAEKALPRLRKRSEARRASLYSLHTSRHPTLLPLSPRPPLVRRR